MGDVRFSRPFDRLTSAENPIEVLHELMDEDAVAALAAASGRDGPDPYLTNVLATEVMNRLRRSRAVVVAADEGLVAVDEAGRFTMVNPAGARMLGHDAGALLGRDAHEALRASDAQGRPWTRERSVIHRALATGAPARERDVTFTRRDGSTVPVDASAAPILVDGEIVGASVAFRDVSERQRTERALDAERRRLESVLDQMPAGVAIAEAPSGRILYHNLEAARLLRHPVIPSDDYRGYAKYGALHADGTPYAPDEHPLARALLNGELVRDHELLYRRGDGTLTYLSANAAPIVDEDGRAVAAVATFHDVTARKRAERAAERAGRLHRVTAALSHSLPPERIVEAVLEEAVPAVHATTGVVVVLDDDGRTLRRLAGNGCPEDALDAGTLGDADARVPLAEAVRDGLPVFTETPDELLNRYPSLASVRARLGHASTASIPLAVGGRTLGAIGFSFKEVHPFDREERDFMQTVANVVAQSLERRAAESDRDAAAERTVAVLESVTDAFYSLDAEWRFTYANTAATRVLGRSREALIGRSVWDLYPEAQGTKFHKEFERAVRERVSVTFQEYYPPFDAWFDVRVFPMEPGGVSVYFRDVTARHRAEDVMRARARQQECVAKLGSDALRGVPVTRVLDEAVESVAETLGVDLVQVLEMQPDASSFVLSAGAGWRDGVVGRVTVPTEEGSHAGFTLTSRGPVISRDLRKETRFRPGPHLIDHGAVSGVSCVIPRVREHGAYGVIAAYATGAREFTADDVNFLQGVANVLAGALHHRELEAQRAQESRELERRVGERTRQLAAANRELEAFTYSASHDLRAPLRGIDALSHAILEDLADRLTPEEVGMVQRLRVESDRLSRLVDGLLALSRIGQGTVRREDVDVTALAREVISDLRSRETGRHVDATVQDGLQASADPALTRAVLENFLSNAWKYTRRVPHARVSVGRVERDGRRWLYVRDNGVGFDAAARARLFAPFTRFHAQDGFEGTGIGLATVRRIAERHGGAVDAEGTPGTGATFYVSLEPEPDAWTTRSGS